MSNIKQDSWYIILDESAGEGLARRRWPKIEQELQRQGFSYTIKFAESNERVSRLTDDGILNGHRKILGIGDDATHLEICSGILQNKWAAPADILYGLLPVGSTNNKWARRWKILSGVQRRLERLQSEQTAWQDEGTDKALRICL